MTKFLGVTIEAGGLAFQESGLESGSITELYTAINGANELVDVNNTTALYDPAGDTYGQGVVQTKRLYDSSTAITSLLINDISSLVVTTRGTVDVSFDDGNSWSTASNNIGATISSFTGTTHDGGIYKLKLKFTLGATYDESGSYVWVTTSSLTIPKSGRGSAGTVSDALIFGGLTQNGGGAGYTNSTILWNGSIWSTTGNLSYAGEGCIGCGTISAALCFGGTTALFAEVNNTDKWDGSAWATTTVLLRALHYSAGCGTTSTAINFGGTEPTIANTDKWTGSEWVTTSALARVTSYNGGCGTASAALNVGGTTSGNSNKTDKWDGSTWSTTTNYPFACNIPTCIGTTSDSLGIGGNTGAYINLVNKWTESLWVTTVAMILPRGMCECAGTTSGALAASGITGDTASNTTERWINTGIQKGFSAKIN